MDQPPVLSPQPGDLALGQRGFLGKRRKHDPQPVEAVDNGTFELNRVLIAHGHLRLTWKIRMSRITDPGSVALRGSPRARERPSHSLAIGEVHGPVIGRPGVGPVPYGGLIAAGE